VLDDAGIVRHDIRRSFGAGRTLATGVPLRVNLTVTDASNGDETSQIALPRAASPAADNVFGDDRAIHQLATVTGSVKEGFVANLTIGV
jgi:hypothetical protein